MGNYLVMCRSYLVMMDDIHKDSHVHQGWEEEDGGGGQGAVMNMRYGDCVCARRHQ